MSLTLRLGQPRTGENTIIGQRFMMILSVRPQVTFDWICGLDLWLEVSRVAPGFRQAEIYDLRDRKMAPIKKMEPFFQNVLLKNHAF